jgi:hypothetical protein
VCVPGPHQRVLSLRQGWIRSKSESIRMRFRAAEEAGTWSNIFRLMADSEVRPPRPGARALVTEAS